MVVKGDCMHIDQKNILSLYDLGWSCRAIGRKYQCNPKTIAKIIKKTGVKIKSNVEMLRKYPINETFFDSIDSKEKAYILGFFYADGYNHEKKNLVKIELHERDKDILEKMRELICPTKPLRSYAQKGYSVCVMYRLAIDNAHISERLAEIGGVQNKTHKLTFPAFLNKELIQSFLLGYFDGDGSITSSHDKKCPSYVRYAISITSNEPFLLSMSSIVQSALGINRPKLQKRWKNRIDAIKTLLYGGNRQVHKILSWLYEGAPMFLERKHNKYLDLCRQLERIDSKPLS
jgi:intein/homing endonuclease